MTLEWVRSDHGWISGVCSGLAPNLGLSPLSLRILWLCSIFMFGVGLVMYVVCWLCLPARSKAERSDESKVLGGCLQISRRLGIEVGLIRCILIICFPLSISATVIIYIAASILLPPLSPEVVDHGRRNFGPQ